MDQDLKATLSRIVEALDRLAPRNPPGADLDAAARSEQPLRGAWAYANNPKGTALLMEFMALANHRKEIRSEIADFAARFGELEENAVTLALRAHGVDVAEFPPVVMSMIVTSLARILVLERSLGITRGHADAAEFIERILSRYEMPASGADGR